MVVSGIDKLLLHLIRTVPKDTETVPETCMHTGVNHVRIRAWAPGVVTRV